MKNVLLALFIAALLVIHALIGGTRLLFSLPAYGLLALAGVLSIFHRPTAGPRPVTVCLGSTALLVAYVAIRAALSPVAYLWWPDFYLVLACGVAYLLVARHLTRLRDRQLILAVLMAVAVAEVLLALHQFTAGDDWMLFDFHRPLNGRRASGFLISPNHLAGLLEIIGVMSLSCACWSEWRVLARVLAGYVAAACFVGVAITGSRGGYLASAFCLVLFFVLSVAIVWAAHRRKGLMLGLGGLVALALLSMGALALMRGNPLLQERLNALGDQFNGGSGRLDVRIYNWQATLDQIRLAPALGTGSGTHIYFGRLFRRPQLQSDPIHAHSDYLELVAEYGLAGAAVMALFVGVHVWAGGRRLRALVREELLTHGVMLNDQLALTLGALCAVGAIFIHSAVDFNMHIPGNALLMAGLFGILAARPPDRGAAAANAPFWLRLPLPLLSASVLFLGIPKIAGEYWSEQARKALGRQNVEKAIEFANRGLKFEAQNPYLYFYLGEAKRASALELRVRSLRNPFLESSRESFTHSLHLFPQDETTWIRLGQTLDGLRDFNAAETAFLTALELDPNLGVLYGYYAAHLRQCGRYDEAEQMLAKGQALTPQNLQRLMERAENASGSGDE